MFVSVLGGGTKVLVDYRTLVNFSTEIESLQGHRDSVLYWKPRLQWWKRGNERRALRYIGIPYIII